MCYDRTRNTEMEAVFGYDLNKFIPEKETKESSSESIGLGSDLSIRRNDISQNTEEELAIRKARVKIECLGANKRLTDAIVHLNKAFELVADYTDELQLKVRRLEMALHPASLELKVIKEKIIKIEIPEHYKEFEPTYRNRKQRREAKRKLKKFRR